MSSPTQQVAVESGEFADSTPGLRLFALLELIGSKDHFVSLQSLTEETGFPKPTVFRMLQTLETAGLIIRQSDKRQYGTGTRLRRFAETLLLNATQVGTRHAVLQALVDDLGETCNITALSGNEILYLDRVETQEPLRFNLQSGSRVPIHCSASGKVLLANMPRAQRHKLLRYAPLKRLTANTITTLEELDEELKRVQSVGFAIDNEEFMSGLVCMAIAVPSAHGRSNQCVAVQAPAMRMTAEDAVALLPRLQSAAAALFEIEAEGSAVSPSTNTGT
jgi:DNA-binding IclR family transcriptional regulator